MKDSSQIICKFHFLCDKKWKDLFEINGEKNVKYCNSCEKPVFYCQSYDELVRNVVENRCVAFSSMQQEDEDLVGFVIPEFLRKEDEK